MKLAILYGTAAQMKLAFVPVVMVCRHFSKVKDRRIRNELQRELETEIRVCEEKINDANANGDQKEKYRLIRIKDQLDAEVIRVKTNSKYV
jgi:transcription elongation GreA/GreB family factor